MEKFLASLKNKTISYYFVAANALLGIIAGIFFFATYGFSMANNASGYVPETIGIYLLVGAIIELIVLCLPQYKFVHLIALVFFGLSFYKEATLVPNLIADWINNVGYQGGDLGTNVVYLVFQIIIIALGIASAFMGFFKSEEEEKAEFLDFKSPTKLIEIAACGALLVAVILGGTITDAVLTQKANVGGPEESSEVEEWDPITDDIKAAAEAYDYDFDPASVLIKEQETWDYNDAELKALKTNSITRDGHYLVYYFEGSYSEGWQGDYSESYANLYLWDDGLFAGKSKDQDIRGYWFNSSIASGVDEEGNDIKDCLTMVSNVSSYESILTEPTSGGFYERSGYIFIAPWGGGQRSIIVNGYMYYPEVALFIDAGVNGAALKYKVGEYFSSSSWSAKRVLKNLNYSSVFKSGEVKWDVPAELKDGVLETAGTYTVGASWNGLSTSIEVVVE